MDGLKLKYFPESGLIRSIGEQPNGILCLFHIRTPACFAISPSVKAPEGLPSGTMMVSAPTGISEDAVLLELGDVVGAAADKETLGMLWASVVLTANVAVGQLNRFDPGPLHNLSELAVDLQPRLGIALERFDA